MDGLQLENRTQVILWLRENYKHATTTSVSKRSVFAHYLDACKKQNVLTPISHTYFGKLVRKAFPDVRCNRKGPRGSAQQHYRLIRADGGDADEFLSALGDEHDDVHVDYGEDDEEDEFAAKSAAKRKKANGKKKAKTAAALRKNGVSRPTSRARAAATAAASTISRMINADQAPANLTEAWSFSSAPSSPSFSMASSQHGGAESIPSSPGAQSSSSEYEQEEQLPVEQQLVEFEDVIEEEVLDEGHEEVFQQRQNEEDLDEDDDYEDELDEEEQAEEEQVEEEVDEQDEEEDEQAEEDEVEEFNFDLPQFEITPGEESPGTSFSYEACPPLSGHDQNLRLQQQLLLSSSSGSSVQQQAFEPSAFYDFVSPDLEMPLSAINQVANLAEDFGWSMPSMPSAVDRCHMAAAAYGSQSAMMMQQQQQQRYAYQQQQQQVQQQQQQQQQSSGVLSFLLSEQVPATQCSDLAEWVAHYCI